MGDTNQQPNPLMVSLSNHPSPSFDKLKMSDTNQQPNPLMVSLSNHQARPSTSSG